MSRQLLATVWACVLAVVSSGDVLDNLGVHQWCEIANTAMRAVTPTAPPGTGTYSRFQYTGSNGGRFCRVPQSLRRENRRHPAGVYVIRAQVNGKRFEKVVVKQ